MTLRSPEMGSHKELYTASTFQCFSAVALTGGDYEAVVLPEDQELAGFVPLLSIAYSPVYIARGTDRVSATSFEKRSQIFLMQAS